MAKQKRHSNFDKDFYKLAIEVTKAIENNKKDGTTQEQQVNELVAAERDFKESILKYKQSTAIYVKFLNLIREKNKNILSARPYFRERAKDFSKLVTPPIKEKNIELLKTFNINYKFITFIKNVWLGPFPKKAQELYERVFLAREKLIQNNTPLAINQAKLFYRKNPANHLDYHDMIDICMEGLCAGIDKWCGPYSKVFISSCLGRAKGNLMEAVSESVIHMYPSHRRILYKANMIRSRRGIENIEELTKAINESFRQDGLDGKSMPKKEVTVSELSSLLSAASIVSADQTVNEEGYGVYAYTEDETKDTEGNYINKESMSRMIHCTKDLPLIHKKILRLKGVKI